MPDYCISYIKTSKIGIILLYLIFQSACNQAEDFSDIYSQYSSMKSLEPIDSLVLHLDHETTPALRATEILEDSINTYLFFKVLDLNLIKKYNLNDSKLISTIDLRFEGPNRLNLIHVCKHVSQDTLICIDHVGIVLLIPYKSINGGVKKLNSFKARAESRLLFDPELMPPITIDTNKYIIANYFTRGYNEKLLSIVDFESNGIELYIDVPPEYISGYFGFKRFGYWNYVYHEKNKEFYFNFPNLDSVYVYHSDFSLKKKIQLKSKLKQYPNAPLFKEEDPGIAAQNGVTAQEKDFIGKMQFIYEALLYNEKKQDYYRIVGLPIPQYLIELDDSIKSEIRNYSLIVSNSELQYQTEYSIPYHKYELELKAYFVHDGKLYLQRKTTSEDYLVIDVFDL